MALTKTQMRDIVTEVCEAAITQIYGVMAHDRRLNTEQMVRIIERIEEKLIDKLEIRRGAKWIG